MPAMRQATPVRVVSWIFVCLAAAAADAVASEETAYERRIWRIDDALERGQGCRDASRLDDAIGKLERRLHTVSDDRRDAMARKLRVLRARLAGGEPCSPEPPRPPRGARVTEAGRTCAAATPIELGSVLAPLPAARGRALTDTLPGDAWFRFDAPRAGRFEANTRGSTADTEIEIHGHCDPGARPLAHDDDGLGLRSAVSFDVRSGERRYIRVRQRVGRAADPLALTLRGAPTGITGVVTDATSGAPLEGVWVDIRRRADGGYEGADYTGQNGSFLVDGLEAGTHVAVIDGVASDHLGELWDDRPCADGCDATTGDPIAVTDGAITTGVDFALRRAGTIAGRLRDSENGEPIAGFRVETENGDGYRYTSTTTDAGGRYRLTGLLADTYYVYTDGWGYRNELYDDIPCGEYCDDPLDGTPIAVAEEALVVDIDFDLDRLGVVAGTVTDAQTGQPLPFVDVEVFDGTGSYVGSADAGLDGRYAVGGLPTGSYFVATDEFRDYRNEVYDDVPCPGSGTGDCVPLAGASVAVTAGETTGGIDFALEPLGKIVGTVTDAGTGAPISGSSMRLFDPSGDYVDGETTNPIGLYVFTNLAAGSYFVSTRDEESYLDELYDDLPCPVVGAPLCDPTAGTPVAVSLAATTTGIDFALARGGVVSGEILDEVTGDPLDDERVRLWTSSGVLVGSESTEPDGIYRFGGLPTGTYHLTSDTRGDYLDELFDALPCPGGAPAGCDPTSGSPIAVTAGATTGGVNLSLTRAGGISGVVTVARTGQPIAGAAIDVWDDAGELIGSGATDAAGLYLIDTASGSFYVSSDAGGDLVDQVYDGRSCFQGPAALGLCDPLLGTPVEVIGAGEPVTGIDFALGEEIFADGFDGGDTQAWGMTVPAP